MRRDTFDASSRWQRHHHGEVPVETASESYREFTLWLDRELEKLVGRWAPTAAPGASSPERLRARPVKPT